MSRMTGLFRRARHLYRTEGCAVLAKSSFAFVTDRLLKSQTYTLLEHSPSVIQNMAEDDLMPRLEDFTLKIVTTNAEADELEDKGFEFRSCAFNSRERLDKGAVAFVVFVGHEFGSVAWVAMSQEAVDTLGEPPVKMDFAAGEALTGAVHTNPKYRRMRLNLYMGLHIRQFLLDHGIAVMRGAVGNANIASLRANDKFSPRVYAEARYLRILWWKHWTEKPLPPDFNMSDVIG